MLPRLWVGHKINQSTVPVDRYDPGSSADGGHLRRFVHALARRLRNSRLVHVLRQRGPVARISTPLRRRFGRLAGGNDSCRRLLPAADRRRRRGREGELGGGKEAGPTEMTRRIQFQTDF